MQKSAEALAFGPSLFGVGDFNEVAVGIPDVDRAERILGARSRHGAEFDRDAFRIEVLDPVFNGGCAQKAEIGASFGRAARMRRDFPALEMKIDFLAAQTNGFSAGAEGDFTAAENAAVEVERFSKVRHGEHEVVERVELRLCRLHWMEWRCCFKTLEKGC